MATATAVRPCTRCPGSRGTYYWGAVVNGRPSRSGTCFRCEGTGRMSVTVKPSTAPAHVAATYVNSLRLSDKFEVSIVIAGKRWAAHLVAAPAGIGPMSATSTKGPREAAANVAKRLREMGYTGAVRVVSWPHGEVR